MKLPLILLAAVGCGSAATKTPTSNVKPRSVEACEKLLKHSLDTEQALATITLSDHKYQTRKIERQYAEAYEKMRKDPEFLPLCRAITDAEYNCMMNAKDPYSIDGCKTSVAKAKPSAPEPSDVIPITDDAEAH